MGYFMDSSSCSSTSSHSVLQGDGPPDKEVRILAETLELDSQLKTPTAISSNRSAKDHNASAAANAPPCPLNTFGVDPPRPAKEGFEWVWFPEGYWAEREFKLLPQPATDTAAASKTSDVSKGWKSWRRRSGKSGSGSGRERDSHEYDPTTVSPRTLLTTVVGTGPNSPQSPFLSEEAHVHSLQYPESHLIHPGARAVSAGESEWLVPKPKVLQTQASTKTSPEANVNVKPRRRFPSLSWKLQGISSQNTRELRGKEMVSPRERNRESSADSVRRPSNQLPDGGGKEAKVEVTDAKVEVDCNGKILPSKGSAARLRLLFGGDHSIRRRKRSRQSRSSLATSSTSEMATDALPTGHPKPSAKKPLPSPQIWASQFPGGEAIRVHTPPLKEDTVDGKPRGLFFDVNAIRREGDGESGSTNNSRGTQTADGSPGPRRHHHSKKDGSSRIKKQREWWDTPPTSRKKFIFPPSSNDMGDTTESGVSGASDDGDSFREPMGPVAASPKRRRDTKDKGGSKSEMNRSPFDYHQHQQPQSAASTPGEGPYRRAALFEFNIPEHLPTSPMCPAHPKNKSKGKGVCVYHGRRKSVLKTGSEGALDLM